jgi:hypothetical protein
MPALTRRRDPEACHECWRISYGDVQVGTIGLRAGVPDNVDQWGWSCGFYPLSHRGRRAQGTAQTFSQARADFDAAWRDYLPTCTEADFTEHRRERAWTAWKYRMHDSGCRMPTQVPELRSRCFCGVAIDSATMDRHIAAVHMVP